jgi:hypothetical protein
MQRLFRYPLWLRPRRDGGSVKATCTCVALVAVAAALGAGCGGSADPVTPNGSADPVAPNGSAGDTPNPFTTAAARTAEIHFIPLDARAQQLLAATVPIVKTWADDRSEITEIPTAGPNWLNRERRQLNGLVIMRDLLARFKRVQGGRQSFLLAVTSGSMYSPETPAYRFVFGLGVSEEQRGQVTKIVATAQMRAFHPEREKERLAKMMLRYIGEVVCRLPRNDNPKSVMSRTIGSDADLDRMVAKLPRRC